ncbi:LacI family DNA-binding transcriptional regulator, partial [Klebsiella pneumoniae]|nr:LacI family DNA-binding transcriptional regulator [Klebsiella pneumoniae]MCJ3125734.1 LacI family DNA-binding transcriptional regulator [Klebsiella pneumoniae]
EWVHVQLHQQKGMISLSPPTICNSAEGICKAKTEGKYRGRVADAQKHELIRTLRLAHGKSLRETARLAGVSKMTVIRVCNGNHKQDTD